MESTKTSKSILLVSLLVFGVGLTSIDIYQDHVIQKQRFELEWLAAHATIRPETIVADLAKAGKLPQKLAPGQEPGKEKVQAQAPAVPSAHASAPPAAQVSSAVKP